MEHLSGVKSFILELGTRVSLGVASSSPKVIYVVHLAIMFAKRDEKVKLIFILTFHKCYIAFPSEQFRPETWPGKPVAKATPVRQLTVGS